VRADATRGGDIVIVLTLLFAVGIAVIAALPRIVGAVHYQLIDSGHRADEQHHRRQQAEADRREQTNRERDATYARHIADLADRADAADRDWDAHVADQIDISGQPSSLPMRRVPLTPYPAPAVEPELPDLDPATRKRLLAEADRIINHDNPETGL
jgi:hypothetical protein